LFSPQRVVKSGEEQGQVLLFAYQSKAESWDQVLLFVITRTNAIYTDRQKTRPDPI